MMPLGRANPGLLNMATIIDAHANDRELDDVDYKNMQGQWQSALPMFLSKMIFGDSYLEGYPFDRWEQFTDPGSINPGFTPTEIDNTFTIDTLGGVNPDTLNHININGGLLDWDNPDTLGAPEQKFPVINKPTLNNSVLDSIGGE